MLNSLVIKNFRMLEDFTVSKLGRVNLIVGKNNSGKSTVLEALRIYAGNANRRLLEEIAVSHDEKFRLSENQNERDIPLPFEDLFTGRQFSKDDDTQIIIGESVISDQLLSIQPVFVVEREEIITDEKGISSQRRYREIIPKADIENFGFAVTQALSVSKAKRLFFVRFDRSSYQSETSTAFPCSFIPTRFISMDELAGEWDKIVFTDNEIIITKALKIILPEFENLVFVESERYERYRSSNSFQRIAKVKLSDTSRPVPLNSLGDGMLRVLQLVLKLFSAQGGFLLIDEFENGLHYSVQEKVWALLFEMAEKLDIQVFATTHSWDCIESFAAVAKNNETTEGVLFRMGRSARKSNYGQIMATVFDKDELYNITQSDVEIR